MIKKISLLLLLVFIFFGKINAQEASSDSLDRPTFYFSITPSSFLHLRLSGVMGGLEYRFHDRWSVAQDIGYTYQNPSRERRHEGFRSRTEIRWYPDEYDPESNFFIGAQFRYWRVQFDDEDVFCRAGCQYQQELEYRVVQTGIGANAMMGVQANWGKRIFTEIGCAVGGIQRSNNPDVPSDATPINQDFLFGRPDGEKYSQFEPVFLGWIKIGFVLF